MTSFANGKMRRIGIWNEKSSKMARRLSSDLEEHWSVFLSSSAQSVVQATPERCAWAQISVPAQKPLIPSIKNITVRNFRRRPSTSSDPLCALPAHPINKALQEIPAGLCRALAGYRSQNRTVSKRIGLSLLSWCEASQERDLHFQSFLMSRRSGQTLTAFSQRWHVEEFFKFNRRWMHVREL
jgi:hypothetical protein